MGTVKLKKVYELDLYGTEWYVYNDVYVYARMPPCPQICDARMCGDHMADIDEEIAIDDGDKENGWSKKHARLIAAAPDLYDALYELFIATVKETATEKEMAIATKRALAALKKAGGADENGWENEGEGND